MLEFVELENETTGKVRVFPKTIFNSLVSMCLGMLPDNQRERAEEQVGRMVGQFLDADPAAAPILEAALALFPDQEQPLIAMDVEAIKLKLGRWATQIYGRYGAPVWLVGSALNGAGRDVDVRIILPDPDFSARFPDDGALALETGKQGRWAALFLRLNVDFQIQKASEATVYEDLPRIRLDAAEYPEAFEPPQEKG